MKSNLRGQQQIVPASSIESTIGVDLGDRWSRYCIVDSAGTIAKEDRVRTTPEALEECFGKIPPSKIVIEAGMHSPWVNRLLQKLGHQVIVANARKVRLIYESNQKNDRVDARMLAKLGRVDVSLLAPVEHRSAEAQTDLVTVRGRDALVAARTQLINAVRGMVKSTGARLPTSTTAAFATKVMSLIPAALQLALNPLFCVLAKDVIDRFPGEVKELLDRALLVQTNVPFKTPDPSSNASDAVVNWCFYRGGSESKRKEQLRNLGMKATDERGRQKIERTQVFLAEMERRHLVGVEAVTVSGLGNPK